MFAEARFLFLDTNIISQKRMDRDESCQRCWAHTTIAGLLQFNANETHQPDGGDIAQKNAERPARKAGGTPPTSALPNGLS
jgi:hypothetical protein